MSVDCKTISVPTYVSYGVEDTILLKKLDKIVLDYLTNYQAEEVIIPSIIDGGVLRALGYFNTFPHLLTVPAYCRKEKIKESISEAAIRSDMTENEDVYLTPAACLHIYPMLKNFNKKCAVYTTLADVYRHEDFFDKNGRLWQFKVREIVFVGNRDFVCSGLDQVFQFVLSLARLYDKDTCIYTASDSFYDTRVNRKKKLLQEANAMKKEIRTKSHIAIASCNYHDTHFSKAFGFDSKNRVVTGCIGLGIDRWILMMKGIDNKNG